MAVVTAGVLLRSSFSTVSSLFQQCFSSVSHPFVGLLAATRAAVSAGRCVKLRCCSSSRTAAGVFFFMSTAAIGPTCVQLLTAGCLGDAY